jgi:translocation and assembly module TamA
MAMLGPLTRLMITSGCCAVLWGAGSAFAQDEHVSIVGLNAVEEEAFRAVLPEREPPRSDLDRERIAEEAAEVARAWLRSEGWYSAQVDVIENNGATRVHVEKGARFQFAPPTIAFEGERAPPQIDATLHGALSSVASGAPARASDVLRSEAALLRAAREGGYADAKLLPRRVIVDHASATMSVTYALSLGAPATLGEVQIAQADALRPDFLARLAPWDVGQPYDENALASLRASLAETGAFAGVDVKLAEGAGPRAVLVDIAPARPRVLEIGASWSTFEGIGAEVEWTRRNATRRADSVSLVLTLAQEAQSASVAWTLPHVRGRGQSLRLASDLSREETDAFTRQGARASVVLEASAQVKSAITYGAELSADQFEDSGGVQDALVLSGFLDWRRDTSDRLLDARDGAVFQARIEPAVSTGSASVGFVRAIAQARAYETPGGEDGRLTYAARVRAGWIEPVLGNQDDLPPDRRFYAGGGGSVRGYAFNSIRPESRDARDVAPGGRGLLELSGETRFRLNEKWGLAAFVDGAGAFDDVDGAADFRWGAGVGVRYDLGLAPLRLDIAAPFDRRDGEDAVAIYLSIGQAF